MFVLFYMSCWDLIGQMNLSSEGSFCLFYSVCHVEISQTMITLPFIAKAAMSMDGCAKYASCFDLLSSYWILKKKFTKKTFEVKLKIMEFAHTLGIAGKSLASRIGRLFGIF